MQQIHTCRPRACLVVDKNGRVRCKRHAPFDINLSDFIDELGHWGPKRLYAFVNSFIPDVLTIGRCNMDAKYLTNGEDTKNLTFYITGYATKGQPRTHSTSAIVADTYAYHAQTSDYVDSLRDRSRLLVFRLVHSINREQELAGPMVMSYLMGWGDVYRSHHYTAIYWTAFVRHLLDVFPKLKR
ncbi:hypothetical protein EV121DRAFT_194565 [Schizophyllum commune]